MQPKKKPKPKTIIIRQINKQWGKGRGKLKIHTPTHSHTLTHSHIHQRKEENIGIATIVSSAAGSKRWQEGIAVPSRSASGAMQMRWCQMDMVLRREARSRARRKGELNRLYRSIYGTSQGFWKYQRENFCRGLGSCIISETKLIEEEKQNAC